MSGGRSDYQRIAAAIRFLGDHVDEQPSLAAVAAHIGLSESHAHRLFHKLVGVTPKDFLQVLTLTQARRLLADDASVLDASHAVGLSGAGRLHDLFVTHEGMTPGEYKARGTGLVVSWCWLPTPLGQALLAATARGLCALAFVEPGREPDAVAELAARWPDAELAEAVDDPALRAMAEAVQRRIAGEPGAPLTLVLRGTPFQVKVWEALLRLPDGALVSYGGLARAAGAEAAVRATASAVAANQIACLVPCHRVIRASGALGEYRWGAERKAALVALEAARRGAKK
jgi:AraC family transcriptional regulator of adaptative response/methylated-DNA-[protein]-cysteine methyltransferase